MSLDVLALEFTDMQLKYSKEISAFLDFIFSSNSALLFGQDRILIYLYKENDHILVGDLTNELQMSTGRIANILKELERKGYILRIQQREDKRKYEVCLTKSGENYSRELYADMVANHRALMEQLGETDGEQLLKLSEKVLRFRKTMVCK